MSEIQEILAQNIRHVLADSPPSSEEIVRAEEKLSWRFPAEYCEFLVLGGLNDLRFRNQVLAPGAVVENATFVSPHHVPFASNGAGDLYCWSREEPKSVFLWDHETTSFLRTAEDFVEWLKVNRF